MPRKGRDSITAGYSMEAKHILHNYSGEVLVDDVHWKAFLLLGGAAHHPHLAQFVPGRVNEQEEDVCVPALHDYAFKSSINGFKGMEDDPCVRLLVVCL